MPYRKRGMRRRRFYRRRRPLTYGMMGSKIMRDIRWLKSVINVEKKYVDTSAATQAISNASTTNILLNGMIQGTSATTRLGQSIKMVASYMKCYLTMSGAATTTVVRVMIVLDRQPNISTFAGSALLANGTEPQSALLIGYGKRFKVIHDKLFRLDTNKLNLEYKYFKKLGIHTEYQTSNGGGVGDITTNALWLVLLSDQAANTPNINYYHRLRFVDN